MKDSRTLALAAALALLATLGGRPAEAQQAPRSPPAMSAVGPIPGPPHERTPRTHPFVRSPAAMATGRELFNVYNCSGCHGGHAGGGMGPSLRDEAWIYGGEDEDVFDSIAQGRANGMPAWGTLLPEPQIWLLTAYVQSLRTSDEPDPPR